MCVYLACVIICRELNQQEGIDAYSSSKTYVGAAARILWNCIVKQQYESDTIESRAIDNPSVRLNSRLYESGGVVNPSGFNC